MQFYYEFEKHLPYPSHFQFTKIHQQYFQDNTVYLGATIFDLLKNLIHIVAHFFEKKVPYDLAPGMFICCSRYVYLLIRHLPGTSSSCKQ